MTGPFAQLKEALADRYQLEAEAGRGGMATVYAARDLKHDRRVAIKVLRPDLAAALGPERFLREIETAARLQHPHILPVYDSGEAAGSLYFVMPLVEGESLRQRLNRERQLPLDEAVRIASQAAEALEFAHSQNIVHRDIKPENILLQYGTVVVADFGIARAITRAAGTQLTGTGMTIGTPDYMSPEQATSDEVDGRSDQYSLGCVLYEMLAGSPPFHGATAQILLARHSLDPAPSLRTARPGIPAAVEGVIRRALAKTPADRYPSMRAFLDALTRAGTATEPGPAPSRRRTKLLGASLAAILLIAAGITGALIIRSGRQEEPRTSDGRPRLAVLPFRSVGSPEDTYLAQGLTDEITSRVAGLSGIAVIARASIARVATGDRSIRDIARDLNVGYVLTGSVQEDRAANGNVAVRVRPELQRASDGEVMWRDSYDVALAPGELLDVQFRIADGVAQAMKVSLLTTERLELAARPTANLAAYEAYLRGNVYFSQSFSEAPWRQALAMYQRAVEEDPRFAVAWARLAQAHTQYYYYFDRTEARLGEARTALNRAFAIDSSLIDAHLAEGLLAYLGSLDFDAAEQHFNAVRHARPSNSEVLYYLATIQRRRGQFDEAETTLRRALELDPRTQLYSLELAVTHLMVRRYRDAERELDRAIEVAPDWLAGHVTRSFLYWVWKADLERARAALREALKTHSMREVLSYLVPLNPNYVLTLDAEFQDSLDALQSRDLAIDPGFVYVAKALSMRRRGDQRAGAYFDSARVVWEPRVQARPQDWRFRIQLGLAYAGLGRKDEALQEGRAAVGLLPLRRDAQAGTYPLNAMVNIAIMSGELDTALVYLRPLLENPSQLSPSMVRADWMFAPLRNKSEFRTLTR